MMRNGCKSKPPVQRIADALGMDAKVFYTGHGELHVAQEALELLSAFERITDVDDRHRCLEFVAAIAARQAEAR